MLSPYRWYSSFRNLFISRNPSILMAATDFDATQAERHKLLSAAAFGVHFELVKDLQEIFEREFERPVFFFYDYFLERPITCFAKPEEEFYRAQIVSAPFLPRIAREAKFFPQVNANIIKDLKKQVEDELWYKGRLRFPELRFEPYNTSFDTELPLHTKRTSLQYSPILSYLYRYWQSRMRLNPAEIRIEEPEFFKKTHIRPFDDLGFNTKNDFVAGVLADLEPEHFRNTYPCNLLLRADPMVAVLGLREYGLVQYPWLRAHEPAATMLAVSIASRTVFWGDCILIFPTPPADGKSKSDLKKLMMRLQEYVAQTYIPMLCLFENYLCEEDLKRNLKEIKEPSAVLKRLINRSEYQYASVSGCDLTTEWVDRNKYFLISIARGKYAPEDLGFKGTLLPDKTLRKAPTIKYDNIFLSLAHSILTNESAEKKLDTLERSLTEVWCDRLVALQNNEKRKVEDSLVFQKYLVASPKMTDLITNAAKIRHQKGKQKDAVPGKGVVKTALVVGGPGSGKDAMAELIALFSPGFRLGHMEKMNMAMFRPKEAAVPLLFGLEISLRRPVTDTRSFEGLLQRSIKLQSTWRDSERGITLIFDELNSLDIDTQGALLRLIENGELKPLGGLNTLEDPFDVLIVGVMNEDPQMITKRPAMEVVLRDKALFGGMLGEMLYETFRAQRRLRDDLYFRFIRGGEIVLPELRDRREDIPVLFYFTVSKNLNFLIPENVNWSIDLSAYEELMDGSLTWDGNLRELQSVARHVLSFANDEYEKRVQQMAAGSSGHAPEQPPYRITGLHVREAIKTVLRGPSKTDR